jgi:hypothetical protein
MTSGFVFLLIMLLLRGSFGGSSLPKAAADAHLDAHKKRQKADRTGNPKDRAEAAQATQTANDLTKVAKQASSQPKPWPQTVPAGLPGFPSSGWEPDAPPPLAVQARASQLLAPLWKRGPGSHKTEHTAGRWITYQAQKMGPKKGVVAYRLVDPQTAAPSSLAV